MNIPKKSMTKWERKKGNDVKQDAAKKGSNAAGTEETDILGV